MPARPGRAGRRRTAIVPIRIEAMTRGTMSIGRRDLVVGGRPAERQPQRAARLLLRIAHRGQHVADLGRAGRARRPDRTGDALEVERHRDGRPVRVGRDDRQQARQALRRVAGQFRARDGDQGRRQAIALGREPGRRLGALRHRSGGTRSPTRPRRRHPRCRRGDGAPAIRPAAGPGCASRAGPTARRRPWAPRTCARRATPGPHRGSGHPRPRTARPGPRRRGTGCPCGHGRPRRCAGSAGSCRPRCWRA